MQQEFTRKVYDVVLAFDCQVEEHFTLRIREECARAGLGFFLLDHIWVNEFLRKLRKGVVGVKVLIDMSSGTFIPGDVFYKVAREVKRQGGRVIDDPDRSRIATDKARFHAVLEKHGVPVPPTIVVRKSDIGAFKLTPEMRQLLGEPFIIKPAWGGGGMGVVRDARNEEDLQRSIKDFDSDAYLFQKRIVPGTIGGRCAWFRIFHVFGELIPCWWDPDSSVYNMLSPAEVRQYNLGRLGELVRTIAKLSGIDFFSTEIGITAEGQYYVIDYLNDECDMRVKSYYTTGVPDEVVRRIARTLVASAAAIIGKSPFDDEFELKQWYVEQRVAEGKPPVL